MTDNGEPRIWTDSQTKVAAIFCGDRAYKKMGVVQAVFDMVSPNVLIEGEARGADLLARAAAEKRGLSVQAGSIEPHPAHWRTYGPRAGPIRNRMMLSRLLWHKYHGYEVLVVAFHDNIAYSKGTTDMQRLATANEVRTWLVDRQVVIV